MGLNTIKNTLNGVETAIAVRTDLCIAKVLGQARQILCWINSNNNKG